tara:strand:+ start:53 stop:565 length:513 start_codon:yes stop_codon:yes gene_type:complete
MEWPPTNFMTYDKFKSDLQDAIDKHPHFQEWLVNKYKMDGYNNIHIRWDFTNIDFSVEKLKQLYYKEQNNLINQNLFKRSVLEISLKSITISKEEEEDYNKRKSEYDSIIAHNQILIRNGCKNIPKPKNVSKPLMMSVCENLSKSIEYEIKNHEELLNKIYNLSKAAKFS